MPWGWRAGTAMADAVPDGPVLLAAAGSCARIVDPM
jgi:hypothetical protein